LVHCKWFAYLTYHESAGAISPPHNPTPQHNYSRISHSIHGQVIFLRCTYRDTLNRVKSALCITSCLFWWGRSGFTSSSSDTGHGPHLPASKGPTPSPEDVNKTPHYSETKNASLFPSSSCYWYGPAAPHLCGEVLVFAARQNTWTYNIQVYVLATQVERAPSEPHALCAWLASTIWACSSTGTKRGLVHFVAGCKRNILLRR
jgi:hypothetical protein